MGWFSSLDEELNWGCREGEGKKGGAVLELRGKEVFSYVCRGHKQMGLGQIAIP